MVALPDPARSRAVLIGVDAYETLPDLPTVHAGVDRLAELLGDPLVWGLPPGHCVVLHNPATPQDVLDAVHEAATAARDAFVLYYAGHGQVSDDGGFHLALPDSQRDRLYKSVPFDALRHELVRVARAPSRVVILDCCFSGRALRGPLMGGGPTAVDLAAVDGTYLMAAAAETKLALAPLGEPYPAFTGELVTVLGEGIPDAPELLEMEVLFRRLRGELMAKGRPVPQQLARNAGHSITLFRNRHTAVRAEGGGENGPPPPYRRPSRLGGRRWPRWLRRRRWRGWRWPLGAVAAVVAAALAVAHLPMGGGDAGGRGPSNVPSTGEAGGASRGSRIGDPQTADPCALARTASLARYGKTLIDPDYGNFDRCDMLVTMPDGGTVDVVIDLNSGGRSDLARVDRTEGVVDVVRHPPGSQACHVTLLPHTDPDANVAVIAKRSEGTAPFCEMAAAAADSAVDVLNAGPIARRPAFPPASLVHLDTCTLLGSEEFATVPGLRHQPSDVGFGNWDCEWRSSVGDMSLEIRFDRGDPPKTGSGAVTVIGGRQAIVTPDGEGENTCLIRVVHRSYTNEESDEAVETVNVTVGGSRSQSQLRQMATRLAATVVEQLPRV
ncbi:caspase family protein [Streptomyces sp. NPDC057638]|uniref:caspase, EACC1-associated type n=1 Tax=Streptomyces sp. NPDC057638 TaxID=3346190 RepID=UPI0036825A73